MKRPESNTSRRSLIEIGALLGAFVVDLWYLQGLSNPIFELPALGVVAAVFASSIKRRGGFKRILPHSPGSSGEAWLEMLVATAAPVIGLFLLSVTVRGPFDELPLKVTQAGALGLMIWAGQHLIWAGLQQGLLQLFLRPVVAEILRKPALATGATALLFGLLHLPCPILVFSTTILGALWMILYSRSGRLGPLIVSHATLAALAYVVVPAPWSCDLSVGIAAWKRQSEYRILRSPETRAILETVTSDANFKNSGENNRIYIKSLYQDMLERTPADAEVEHWLNRLNDGWSRNRVALAFAGSREFRMKASEKKSRAKGAK